MKTFFLKTPAKFFSAVWANTKPFELLEDKGFQVGDRIVRLEFHESANQFTGRLADACISYKIESSELGLKKGFCVIGLPNVKLEEVYKKEGSFVSYVPSIQQLYSEGLKQLNKELEAAYAECSSELEDELDPQLEVYLNNDYHYRQDAA